MQTSSLLNKNFGKSFKRISSTKDFQSKWFYLYIKSNKIFDVERNQISNYSNYAWSLKRHIAQSPYSKQQNIISKYSLGKFSS